MSKYLDFEIKCKECENIIFDFTECGVIWTPWDKEDIAYFGDEVFIKKAKSSVVFHEIRRQYVNEDSVDIVYSKLQDEFKITREVLDELKENEKKVFIKYCRPWNVVLKLFNIADNQKCKIFILNNSIYDEETVKHALKKCGYLESIKIIGQDIAIDMCSSDETTMYVGANERVLQNTKNYYKMVTPMDLLENSPSEELVNVACGNFISEGKVLNSAGIKTARRFVAYNYYDELSDVWKRRSRCNADAQYVGYYMLGMHILGICKWIIKTSQIIGAEKIYFCARDGFLVYKAYQIIREKNKNLPEAEYIQASRRALLPVIIKGKSDFYAPPGILFYQSTPRSVMKFFWCFTKDADIYDFKYNSFNEHLESIREEIEKQGFPFDNTFLNKTQYDEFITFFLDNYYSEDKHNALMEAVYTYYQNIGSKDVIFDAGYSGKLARAMKELNPRIKEVMYLYTDEECSELIESTMNINIHSFYNVTPCEDNMFREYLIAENGPTCVGIGLNKEKKCIPVFDDEKYEASKAITDMHTFALKFVEDFIADGYDLLSTLPFKGQEMSLPFEGFFRDINEYDLEMFNSTYQDDYYTGEPMKQNWGDQYRCMIASLPKLPEKRISKDLLQWFLSKKKVAYWGTGKIYKRLHEKYTNIVPDILIDNNVVQNKIDGINVVKLDEIGNIMDYYYIIVNNFYEEISAQLKKKGLIEYKDFIWYKDLF